jgi:YD repeat-containing protein
MRLVTIYLVVSLVLLALPIQAQLNEQRYAADNYRPTTPGAYSILKYLSNPTDLYHGIPQISIPIYTMQVGQKSFPLSFTYHAGGIRVTEEASWVGLGWDLTLPTIVQAINDEDDLTPNLTSSYIIPRRRPDWPLPDAGYSIALPQRYQSIVSTTYNSSNKPGFGWSNPYPATGSKPNPEAKHYYKSCLNYYIPVDKNFDTYQDNMFTYRVDSEPDVFTINLFGTILNFSKNFDTGSIVLLNSTIYNVIQTGNGWSIQDGDGYTYRFANKNVHTASVADASIFSTTSSTNEPSLVVWYLSSITSPDGQQASFTYSKPYSARTTVDFVQKYQFANRENDSQSYSTIGEAYEIPPTYPAANIYPNNVFPTSSFTQETKVYIQSISCDNATIDFYASSRLDITKAQQLDSLQVYDARHSAVLKRMNLAHDYFIANSTASSTHTFSTRDASGSETQRNDLRLRLTSLHESSTGTYSFSYDAESLPPRNCFAQDFWGYYNGAYDNNSLVPSAIRLGYRPRLSGKSPTLPDNNNNNGARLPFARAGVLTRMTFPTGGSKQYEYELNTYASLDMANNYSSAAHLPDYDSLDNKIIKGNGLRVKRITSYPLANGQPLVTDYVYFNGRAMLPTTYYREIGYNVVYPPGGGPNGDPRVDYYTIYELKSAFQYSPALIGSGTGVGYSRVEERQNGSGMVPSGGTSIYYYANSPDVDQANDPGFYANAMGGLRPATQIALPAYQNPRSKMNGLIDSVYYVNEGGRLLRKTLYTYQTRLSSIDYGVKFFSGGVHYETTQYDGYKALVKWPKSYVGYYPIFGKRSCKLSETNVDYGLNGTAFLRKTTYSIDDRDRITSKRDENYTLTSAGKPASFEPGVTYTYTYPDIRLRDIDWMLFNQNRLNNPVVLTEVHAVDAAIHPGISGLAYSYEKFYASISSGAVLDSVVETATSPTETISRRKVTHYRAYDALNRPRQIKVGQDVPTTHLWYDQGALELATVKNATPTSVLCTSFELGEPATWTYPVPVTRGGVTGSFCLPLVKGITTPTLPAGTYTFSYWAKGEVSPLTASAPAGTYQVRTQRTVVRADGWAQYQGVLTLLAAANANPVSLSLAASSTGLLDEFRLYPVGGQMVSYTYGPWQTLTSQTDVTGRLTIYEYDGAGRLIRTRDEQGRILSQQQYHYAGK